MARCALLLMLLVASAGPAGACPFCTAVLPSLSQRREEASLAVLVEVAAADAAQWQCTVRKVLSGEEQLANRQTITLERGEAVAGDAKAGQLALLLATRSAEAASLAWEIVPLDEVAYAYVVRAPSRRLPAATRLPYYAKFLEHANPFLAEDAYLEFGHASYDEVAQVADRLPMDALRRWMLDPKIPESRKGFYGLALGLAKSDEDRRANQALLQQLISQPADDFRAGFDGALGGYLVLAGAAGLERIEERLLANPEAGVGDLRHAMTALRFFHEFGGETIPAADLNRALRRLLARPEVASAAIVDLARWQDWDALPQIVALFNRSGYAEPAISRAIVGYLLACPRAEAADALAKLRRSDPQRVAEALRQGLLVPASQ